MKLSNLFLLLLCLSIPVQASESKGASSHSLESTKSLFAETAGKSVLLPRSLSKTYFGNNFFDDASVESLSHLSNSNNKHFSEYRFQSDNDSKYSDSPQHSNHASSHHVPPDIFSHYLTHEMHGNEHLSFYNKEMKEHGWDIHDRWENHHICTPVPEPETYVMVLLGLLMIVVMKRRKT